MGEDSERQGRHSLGLDVALVAPWPRPSLLARGWALFWKRGVSLSAGRRIPGSLWPGCDGRSVLRSRPSSCAPCSRGRESCVPEKSNYNRRGRSRSYNRGTIMKLIIRSLKTLMSLAAGGSAPGPPTYTIPASLEKVAEDLAPLGPQPPFSRSSGDTETTQISRHTTATLTTMAEEGSTRVTAWRAIVVETHGG